MPDPVQLKLNLLPLEDTIEVFTAARVANVSAETIRRWCEEGRITSYKLVGRWKIDRTAFFAFIAKAKQSYRV